MSVKRAAERGERSPPVSQETFLHSPNQYTFLRFLAIFLFFFKLAIILKTHARDCDKDALRRGIHGFGKRNRDMLCFPGHIENIMFF